jgi:hypothetical protein
MQKSLSYLRLAFPLAERAEKGKLIQTTEQQNEKNISAHQWMNAKGAELRFMANS